MPLLGIYLLFEHFMPVKLSFIVIFYLIIPKIGLP